MKRRSGTLFISLALGVGSTLLMLWLLGIGMSTRTALAAEPQVCPVGCTYSSIQAAVDAASDGDIIKVAGGSYTDIHQRGGVTQVVYIETSVTIRGGYTTTNGFADPPDPEANPTVLNALDQGRVVYMVSGITVTLEGLQLVGGNGSGLGGGTGLYTDAGGGFYANQATTIISDCVIASNRSPMAGGGYVNGGTFTLQGSVITANVAISGNAGGLCLSDPSVATLSWNTITSNTAGFNGGGIYVASGDADTVISHNAIVSNAATYDGGGLFMASGAVLQNNELAHNTAGVSGGALFINGQSPTVASNYVFDNRASNYGGGIYVNREALLQANTILSNTGNLGGGGLLVYNSQGRLENNIVAGNQIGSGRPGAGIYIWSGAPHLLHTTLAENVGGDGSGVHVRDLVGTPGMVFLTNTILVSHTVGIYATAGNTATTEATLWGSGAWANGTDAVGLVISSANVSGLPAFIDPEAGNYHIGPTSEAIDAGVNADISADIDGEPRPAAGGYDIGADEFWRRLYLPLVLRNF